MATTVVSGLEGSYAKDNSFGFANLVQVLIRMVSTVTFVSKSTWKPERMLRLMEKSGCSAKRAQNGSIPIVRSRMVTPTFVN